MCTADKAQITAQQADDAVELLGKYVAQLVKDHDPQTLLHDNVYGKLVKTAGFGIFAAAANDPDNQTEIRQKGMPEVGAELTVRFDPQHNAEILVSVRIVSAESDQKQSG